ncbi:thiamine phosphate synthase [bacterium]|nr:MAG: thiamine phosphate synthase [bacterium]
MDHSTRAPRVLEPAPRRRAALDPRLYVLIDPEHLRGRAPADVAAAALRGGATLLQVRAKRASTRDLLALTDAVLGVARPAGVPVLVNDRVDVAVAAAADGAHVGDDDLPAAAARALLGADAWLGCSAATVAGAVRAADGGADYLGVGDVFGTVSKPDADVPIGIDGLAAVAAATPLPVVAIGGVTPSNAAAAIRAGAAGVAVISAVTLAADVEAAARALRAAVDRARSS